MNQTTLVHKVWNFCNVLKDDGVSYADYLEQLTFLLFLKMAEEYREAKRHGRGAPASSWATLTSKRGPELEATYSRLLREFGNRPGMIGAIFFRAQNKIHDPAKLRHLIQLIDAEQWLHLGTDVKGDLYEGLLQKNAEDTKSGAGQYFTPRALTRAMVECVAPAPSRTIADPACGTGGFFLACHDWLISGCRRPLTKGELEFLRLKTFHGWEIVPNTRRLCLMNLVLHDIGTLTAQPAISRDDALLTAPRQKFHYVFANPPFGKKSSMTFTTQAGEDDDDSLVYRRNDFWETTSNKQLNFVQHIPTMLCPGGQAAVVVPDNVLFEAGAGEGIRRKLLTELDVHTILRLPPGIFYAQGVKANVLFFEKPHPGSTGAKGTWFYDLRTDQRFTLRTKPMRHQDLQDFIRCYSPTNRAARKESERFRFFSTSQLLSRDRANLDIFWLSERGDGRDLRAPDQLAREIAQHLESALRSFRKVASSLGASSRPKLSPVAETASVSSRRRLRVLRP